MSTSGDVKIHKIGGDVTFPKFEFYILCFFVPLFIIGKKTSLFIFLKEYHQEGGNIMFDAYRYILHSTCYTLFFTKRPDFKTFKR
jgi:hypothetical protein